VNSKVEYFSSEKGFEIAYEISGDKNNPKMVLIHGLFFNSDCWRDQLPVFKPEFNILRYDLRGHGKTTKPKKKFALRNYVDDLHALLLHLNWTKELYFVGHSLGGIIAMAYAILYPSPIKKMVVADSFCFVSQEAITDVLGRINSYKLEDFALGISVRGLIPYDEEKAQFVKIIDDNDGDPYEANPGADIDALQHIIPFINNPPLIPEIDGPKTGKLGIEYEFIFNATDPDGDDIKYFIDWGDKNTKWTGYNPSGTEIKVKHSWSKEGTYNITAKAKDIYGTEGPEGTLTVVMPNTKPFSFNFNLPGWFFERFLNAFPLLKFVLGLQ